MQWAKFINPEGDINDINNYIQGTAGSLPPWGNNWRHPDIWKAEGWRNDLPADWIPPTPPQAAVPEKIDPEKLAMAQAIADLYEQLVKLGGNA